MREWNRALAEAQRRRGAEGSGGIGRSRRHGGTKRGGCRRDPVPFPPCADRKLRNLKSGCAAGPVPHASAPLRVDCFPAPQGPPCFRAALRELPPPPTLLQALCASAPLRAEKPAEAAEGRGAGLGAHGGTEAQRGWLPQASGSLSSLCRPKAAQPEKRLRRRPCSSAPLCANSLLRKHPPPCLSASVSEYPSLPLP